MTPQYAAADILSILNRTSDLFSQFPAEDLRHLLSFSNIEEYKKGETILAENVQNNRVFFLLEGVASVYAEGEYILSLEKEGELFGEMSVITGSPTTALIKAESDVILFTILAHKINDSNERELKSMMYKIFLDILTQKLTVTTNRVKGFQATSDALDIKTHELDQTSGILKSILKSMSDGVVVIDINGNLLHANKAFRQMVGDINLPFNISQWPNRVGFFEKPNEKQVYKDVFPLEEIKKGTKIDAIEIFVKNSQMKEGIWLRGSSRPLNSEINRGVIEGTVIVFTDYTNLKEQKLALIRAKEHAESVAKSKSDFLAVMSHELRTPLNGILGTTDLMDLAASKDEQSEHIEVIRKSSQKLLRIISSILDFGDIDSNQLKLVYKKYSFEETLRRKIEQLRPSIEKKGLKFNIVLDQNIPSHLLGDAERVFQVLYNLIHNAKKFTSKGEITVHIKGGHREKDFITLQGFVKDSGIGISDEGQEKLFKVFSQIDSAYSRRFEGVGLGLVLCKKILQLMEGDIQAKNNPDQGATFSFHFNQMLPPESKNPTELRNKPAYKIDKTFSDLYPLKILIVEDNKVNQKLMVKLLGKLGYTGEISENGVLAVEQCRQQHFDVILMDIQMPVMDGIEATRKIRKLETQKAPWIIALTANVTEGISEKCYEAGMNGYVAKPVRIKQIAELLAAQSTDRLKT